MRIYSYNLLSEGTWTMCKYFCNLYGVHPDYRNKIKEYMSDWENKWGDISNKLEEYTNPVIRYQTSINKISEVLNQLSEFCVVCVQEMTTQFMYMLDKYPNITIASINKYSETNGGIYVGVLCHTNYKDKIKQLNVNDDGRTAAVMYDDLVIASRHAPGYYLGESDINKLHECAKKPFESNINSINKIKLHTDKFILAGDMNTYPEAHERYNIFKWCEDNNIKVCRTNKPTELPRSYGEPNNELDYFFVSREGVSFEGPASSEIISSREWNGPVSDHMLIKVDIQNI